MAFGLGVLRLSPTAFWSMTFRELLAASGSGRWSPATRLRREQLERLMAQFPDTAQELGAVDAGPR